jgi:hypothetical protein
MKLLVMALAVGSLLTPNQAAATETAKALQLRPKSAMTDSVAHQYAPFVTPSSEPALALVPQRDVEMHPASRSPCSADSALCYDSGSGHLVYKPARQWMPELPGLQPESISLKRNRLVLRYSFR